MGEFGIVGDPAGMRALADKLVRCADDLRVSRANIRKRWSNVKFKGPFATTVNTALAQQLSQFETAAATLDATAKRLRSAATRVQDEIDAERQRRKWAEYQRKLEEQRRQEQGR